MLPWVTFPGVLGVASTGTPFNSSPDRIFSRTTTSTLGQLLESGSFH